jgi:hypothetical protein
VVDQRFVRERLQLPAPLLRQHKRAMRRAAQGLSGEARAYGERSGIKQMPLDERLARSTLVMLKVLILDQDPPMPPELVIPVGVECVAMLAEQFRNAGVDVADKETAEAMAHVIASACSAARVEAFAGAA